MLKKILLVLVAVTACAALVFAAGGALDGKTFEGDSGEKGKTEVHKDTLIFADGKFRSTGCDQYGFTPAAYTTKTEGDTTWFESTSTSEKEGTNVWKGWVKGTHAKQRWCGRKPARRTWSTGSKDP